MTPRQMEVLRFVEDYAAKNGYSPTLQEIADHMKVSKITVLGHLKNLERAKRIRRAHYRRRAIEVLEPIRRLPVLGRIVAGRPLEVYETPADLDLFEPVRNARETFALEVHGDSMIGDNIQEGDFVIVQKRKQARDGETVVALLEGGEVTLKRFYREGRRIRLQPANPSHEAIIVDRVEIQGVVVGLWRKIWS